MQLRRGVYTPKGHNEQEIALLTIRDHLVKILTGEQPLPMAIMAIETSEEERKQQNLLQKNLIEYLEGKRVVKMKICNDDDK